MDRNSHFPCWRYKFYLWATRRRHEEYSFLRSHKQSRNFCLQGTHFDNFPADWCIRRCPKACTGQKPTLELWKPWRLPPEEPPSPELTWRVETPCVDFWFTRPIDITNSYRPFGFRSATTTRDDGDNTKRDSRYRWPSTNRYRALIKSQVSQERVELIYNNNEIEFQRYLEAQPKCLFPFRFA